MIRVCPICGKVFCPAPMHIYKKKWRGKMYNMCSYTCYNRLQGYMAKDKKKKHTLGQ